jgi:hypothetical protein
MEERPTDKYIALIKAHLIKYGSITSWESIDIYGNTRLAATIHILRDTMSIESKPESYGSKFVRYHYDPEGVIVSSKDPAQLELF